MKKFLVIIALAAIYAAAVSPAEAKTSITDNSKITIVADDDANTQPEGEKEKNKKKKTVKKSSSCCSQKAAVKTSCSQAQKKSCAASKVSCSETKKEDKK